MPCAITYHFAGGTQEQYEKTIEAIHGGPGIHHLPDGQILHAAGPVEDGWRIFAVHDTRESWERFRDDILMPTVQAGIKGTFEGTPEETVYDLHTFLP
jgi:hypothetical protein